MRPQQNIGKIFAGLVSAAGAVVLVLSLLLTAGAVAAPNPGPGSDGPQSANIPYVAWVGEHVRLVVCDRSIVTSGDEGQFVNYQVEDWSGYQFQPPTPDGDAGSSIGQEFDPGPAAFFRSSEPAHRIGENQEQEGCVATDYKSLNPGLTRIRAVVRNQATGAIVFSHQFLVVWLTANKPTLAEAGLSGNINADGSAGDKTFQSQTSTGNLAKFLGDPAGDGKFAPSPFNPQQASNEDKGLVQIKVTGSFPVIKESPLSNILTNASYTLPNDWVTLADTLASSSEETEPPGSEPGLWDIHGTPSEATTPNAGSATNDPLHDLFFRPAFSNDTSGATATVGPFDPQAANETLLSDNRLNVDDAPMPALRIDVSIAANEGGTDLGGVGQISGASKAQIYSHDFTGNAVPEGNLYSPYYGAYIPSTDRPVSEASGIAGPSPGGDFPGFLNEHPNPYTFWNSVHSANNRISSPTGCLRRAPRLATEATPEDDYQTPSGFRTETFYTDERGEAYVTYTPGDAFYLNHIPTITTDANGGCDLESLFNKEIGHSSITARAVYPYEPVDYPPLTSEPLLKTVSSLWLKEIYEFPKGTTTADQNVRIIVAKAQDIDGHPFVGETVCFHAQQDSGVFQFTGSIVDTKGVLGQGEGATINLGGTTVVPSPIPSEGEFCETTNSQGLAAIEVQNSSFPSVDLTTFFVNEGITRDNSLDFSTNAAGQAAKEAAEDEKEVAAEKQKHEEEAAAEKKKHEEEEATAKKKHEEEEAAAKKKHEEEVAKEVAEKKSNEEIEAAKKKHAEEEAAEKKKHEEEAAAEKKKHEEEEAAAKKKHEEEEKAKAGASTAAATTTTTTSLVTPLGGAIAGSTVAPPGNVRGSVASTKSKHHKKAHSTKKGKSKKKGKKKKK
jgi:outer membrane biosynthesis protein TonB